MTITTTNLKMAFALLLAAVVGLLAAVRLQLGETRRPAPTAVTSLPDFRKSPAARAPRPGAPVADGGEDVWLYETLSADERAVVDRGRDASQWEAVHRAFSQSAH